MDAKAMGPAGIRLAVGLVGWGAILFANRWHLTAPVWALLVGWTALVLTGHALWKSFAAVSELGDDDDDEAAANDVTEGRRGDLQREKKALLRALKDCEFDRDMGKMSEEEAQQIIRVYRARAIEIIRELEGGEAASDASIPVRERIELELAARLGAPVKLPEPEPEPAKQPEPGTCPQCTTANDADAVFCKKCGSKLGEAAS